MSPAARKVTRKATATTTRKPAAKAVARKPAAKNSKAKPAAKNAKAAPATRTASNGFDPINVPAIVKALKAGTTMTEIRAQYGAGPKIRKALFAEGYNTLGERIEVEDVSNLTGQKLAKAIVRLRQDRRAWWYVELATGKSEAECRELCEKYGFTDVLEGRMLKADDEAPRPRSVTAEPSEPVTRTPARKAAAKPAAKSTTARKAAPKAKATAAAKRPARRARRANPSKAA